MNYYEDMYVQASEHFPGTVVDMEKQTLSFSMDKFLTEFEETMAHFEEPGYFDISPQYSVVYHKFLEMDLADRPAIRGQLEGAHQLRAQRQGPGRPALSSLTTRYGRFLLEVMARRVNEQLVRLKQINPNAFMFIDEPGASVHLQRPVRLFNDTQAHRDLEQFFASIERPRGVHLCGNPDWDFLLNLDIDVLSLDVYSNGEIFASYAGGHKALFGPRRGSWCGASPPPT